MNECSVDVRARAVLATNTRMTVVVVVVVCRHARKAIATHTAAGYPVTAALCGLRTHQRHQMTALSPDTIKNVAMLCHVMLFVCLLERVWPLGAWHCRVLHANLRRNRVSVDI